MECQDSGDDLTLCSICQDERCTPWQTQTARFLEKNSTQPNSNGGSSHDCWTHEEPDGHRECSKFVPTGNDPWLQCHEQA